MFIFVEGDLDFDLFYEILCVKVFGVVCGCVKVFCMMFVVNILVMSYGLFSVLVIELLNCGVLVVGCFYNMGEGGIFLYY